MTKKGEQVGVVQQLLRFKWLRVWENPHEFNYFVLVLVAVKTLLLAATPLGYDFVSYTSAAAVGDPVVSWSPWIILVNRVYSFWLSLPLAHGDFVRAVAVTPNELLPSYFLLALLIKAPLLISDFAVAYLIYRTSVLLGGSQAISRLASTLWLSNPFSTLIVEMWGSIDVIIVLLSLAGFYFIIEQRAMSGGIALACGIALKLSPIMLWVALVTWTSRLRAHSWSRLPIALAGPVGVGGYFFWVTQAGFNQDGLVTFFRTSVVSQRYAYSPVMQSFSEFLVGDPYKLGIAICAVVAFYLVCAEVWPSDRSTLVSLALSGFLILYALASWFPAAFLWVLPFVALWGSRERRSPLPWIFYLLLALSMAVSHGAELTSNGHSLLFIPLALVPSGGSLVAAFGAGQQILVVNMGLVVTSLFSGFCLLWAAIEAWRSIRTGRTD